MSSRLTPQHHPTPTPYADAGGETQAAPIIASLTALARLLARDVVVDVLREEALGTGQEQAVGDPQPKDP